MNSYGVKLGKVFVQTGGEVSNAGELVNTLVGEVEEATLMNKNSAWVLADKLGGTVFKKVVSYEDINDRPPVLIEQGKFYVMQQVGVFQVIRVNNETGEVTLDLYNDITGEFELITNTFDEIYEKDVSEATQSQIESWENASKDRNDNSLANVIDQAQNVTQI